MVCGDSQTAYSLNPEYWNDLFNYGLQGVVPWQRLLVVSDLIRVNKDKIKYLILDVVPYQMCQPPDPSANRYFLLRIWHRDNPLYRKEPNFIVDGIDFFCRTGFKKLSRCLKWENIKIGKYRSCTCGRFIPVFVRYYDPENPPRADIPSKGPDERIAKFNAAVGFNEKDFRDTERLIDYAQAHGIKVVLTTTPLYV